MQVLQSAEKANVKKQRIRVYVTTKLVLARIFLDVHGQCGEGSRRIGEVLAKFLASGSCRSLSLCARRLCFEEMETRGAGEAARIVGDAESLAWLAERQFSGGLALGNPNIVLHLRLHMQAILDLRAGLEAFDSGNATLGGEHEDGGGDCRMSTLVGHISCTSCSSTSFWHSRKTRGQGMAAADSRTAGSSSSFVQTLDRCKSCGDAWSLLDGHTAADREGGHQNTCLLEADVEAGPVGHL